LVRETADGRWSPPGGRADIGLFPAENAAKDVREESGYSVNVIRLLTVWDTTRHNHPNSVFQIWKLVFLAEIVSIG
jgi:ADP-ribose pyrophosphatase YjhB (NUDIX family)